LRRAACASHVDQATVAAHSCGRHQHHDCNSQFTPHACTPLAQQTPPPPESDDSDAPPIINGWALQAQAGAVGATPPSQVAVSARDEFVDEEELLQAAGIVSEAFPVLCLRRHPWGNRIALWSRRRSQRHIRSGIASARCQNAPPPAAAASPAAGVPAAAAPHAAHAMHSGTEHQQRPHQAGQGPCQAKQRPRLQRQRVCQAARHGHMAYGNGIC
jgi:hypothetical protein